MTGTCSVAAIESARPGRPGQAARQRTAPAGRAGGGGARPAPMPRRRAAPSARLSSRGRALAAGLAVVVVAVAAALLSFAGGPAASAVGHGQPGSAYQGMRQVVVRSGQTLWGLATAAAPAADPFQVMQRIINVNALTGTTIRAGQVLWVPARR